MNKFKADKLFREGKNLCIQGDKKGLEVMTQAIDGYSKDVAEYLSHRGFWRLEFEQYEKALEDASKALKMKPNTINAHKVIFGANFSLGRISECKKAILNIEKQSGALKGRLKLKELNDKLDHYLNDSDIASSYFVEQKYELVVQQAEKNLQLAPKDGKMLFYLASGLYKQKLYDQVIGIKVKLVRNTMKEKEILLMIAESFFALDRLPEAVEVLYKSGGQFNFKNEMETYTRIKILRDLICLNLKEAKFEAVCQAVNEIRALYKSISVENIALRFDIQYTSYQFYLGLEFPEKAMTYLKAAMRLRPNCIQILVELFNLRIKLKDYPGAKKDCQWIIQICKSQNQDSLPWEKNMLALDKFIEFGAIVNDQSKITVEKALGVFGLTRSTASSVEVKKVYFKLLLEYHPDKHADSCDLMKQFATSFTKILNDSKSLLDQSLLSVPTPKSNIQDSSRAQQSNNTSKRKTGAYRHFFPSKEEFEAYFQKRFSSNPGPKI